MNLSSKRLYLVCRACGYERQFDGRLREKIALLEKKEPYEIGLEDIVLYLEQFRCTKCKSKGVNTRTEKIEKAVTLNTAVTSFIASQNAEVFHKCGCKWVKNVNMENLMRFERRETPIALGLEPCKICRP